MYTNIALAEKMVTPLQEEAERLQQLGFVPQTQQTLEEYVLWAKALQQRLIQEQVSIPLSWKDSMQQLQQLGFAMPACLWRGQEADSKSRICLAFFAIEEDSFPVISLSPSFWNREKLTALEQEVLLHEMIHAVRSGVDGNYLTAELYAYSTSNRGYRRSFFLLAVSPYLTIFLIMMLPVVTLIEPESYPKACALLLMLLVSSCGIYGAFCAMRYRIIRLFPKDGLALFFRLSFNQAIVLALRGRLRLRECSASTMLLYCQYPALFKPD
jgi:hypothetical protein